MILWETRADELYNVEVYPIDALGLSLGSSCSTATIHPYLVPIRHSWLKSQIETLLPVLSFRYVIARYDSALTHTCGLSEVAG